MALARKNKSKILHDLQDLSDINKIKKQAEQSAHDLRHFAGRVNELAHEFVGIANDEISDVKRQAVRRIRHDPLPSAATAFVAGFLLRAIFWR